MKQKLFTGTAEGQKVKANKRLQKTQKKKEKRKQKLLEY